MCTRVCPGKEFCESGLRPALRCSPGQVCLGLEGPEGADPRPATVASHHSLSHGAEVAGCGRLAQLDHLSVQGM